MSLRHSCRTSKPSKPQSRICRLPTSKSRPYAFCTARRVPTFLIQPALNTAPPRGSSAGCKLGATTGTFLTFEEGLNNGEALITVPCAPADSRRLGRVMLPHGAHAVIYYDPGTAET